MTNNSTLSIKRKYYYTMVWQYTQRRQKLRDKFGISVIHNGHKKLPEAYKKQSYRLNKKIGVWNREIRKIDMRVKKIAKLKKAVVDFTGQDISNHVGHKVCPKVKIAKSIYYKFGLENGLLGTLLSEHIGSEVRQPSTYRRRFTKSFATTPENKVIWLQFKDFYKTSQNKAI